ncbi:hypothetical protein ENKNEFLB_00546 [Nocardioides aquaticus]|uniref:Uncharacterized protein n=1 Tax=Nocardioides aquaticus TaxID=160826 RepID=A0ABX8EGD7_9ACTN|nr:hypothetical protein [Nocardioides aquaticus]QVT78173.1 hypothetical protein ENKNEFLB_00546 [Nocardioides aquaticus]
MTQRFAFRLDPRYKVLGLPFGITAATTGVELDDELRVRFGPWRLRTPVANLAGVEVSGGYALLKTAGPPHLSFSDRGISFATNGDRGACVSFHEPVHSIEPTGRLRHPGATLTVADVDGFTAAVREVLR